MFRYQILPVTPMQQNCTIFWCEKTGRGGAVDPGGDLPRLREFVQQQKIALETILVTHGHLDHVGGVQALAQELSLPIIGPHRDDKFWIDGLPQLAERFGLSGAQSFEPDRWLVHGDRVEAAGAEFQVLHCPGHTPGHVVFFQPEDRIALVGDVLFKGSIGRTDFPRGNHEQLIESIRRHLWPLGSDVTFIPGHGPVSTFGAERASNGYVADAVLGETPQGDTPQGDTRPDPS